MVSKDRPTNACIDTSGLAHATYSASGSDRWMNCSGSISLSARAPTPRDSIYAKEGTEAHSCLEFLLKNRNKIDAALRQARKKYSQEMIEYCMIAFDWIMERFSKYPDADFLCETRVDSSSFTCEGQFGTVDCAIAAEFDHLTVIDFKYGAGISVDPSGHDDEGNSQLVYYALGISHLYHHNFASASVVVIQPRAYHESGETIREFNIDMDDLIGWGEKFKAGVARTRKFPEVYTPGSWCKFCPADVICPSLKKEAEKAYAFPVVTPVGKEVAAGKKEIPSKELSGLLSVAEKAEKWIEAIREYALDRMIQGDEIEGWRLADKRGRRAWFNEDDPEMILDAEVLIGSQAWTTQKIKSPAEISKLRPPGASKEDIEGFVDYWSETKSSGFTMKKDKPRKVTGLFEPVLINVTPTKGKRK